MTNSVAGELTGLELPVERGCPFALPAEYERLREQGSISKVRLFSGAEVWWVSGHEESRAILADRRFSSDRRKDGFPLVNFDAATLQQLRSQPPLMLGMDGAEADVARGSSSTRPAVRAYSATWNGTRASSNRGPDRRRPAA